MKDNISGMLSPSEKLLYVYDTHSVECIMYLYVQSILLEFLYFNVCVISAGWLVHWAKCIFSSLCRSFKMTNYLSVTLAESIPLPSFCLAPALSPSFPRPFSQHSIPPRRSFPPSLPPSVSPWSMFLQERGSVGRLESALFFSPSFINPYPPYLFAFSYCHLLVCVCARARLPD